MSKPTTPSFVITTEVINSKMYYTLVTYSNFHQVLQVFMIDWILSKLVEVNFDNYLLNCYSYNYPSFFLTNYFHHFLSFMDFNF